MFDELEKRLFDYIKERGFRLTVISEKLEIPCWRLTACSREQKQLTVCEYLAICAFIDIDPTELWIKEETR